MTKKYFFLFLLLFVAVNSFSQSEFSKLIAGKVTSNSTKLNEILIVNLKSRESSSCDKLGHFEIKATLYDTISFWAIELEMKKIVVTKEVLNDAFLWINMDEKSILLDEVSVNNFKKINAVSLGILNKPAKTYTVAQRRTIAAAGSPIEGLYNLISGNKKRLKKNLEIEKKEMAIEKMNVMLPENYFVETLKIPAEKVLAFEYYCVENAELLKVISSKNKTKLKFELIDFARNYIIEQKQ